MNYKELFDDTETFIEKRLNEEPGEENETLKEAGFREVWSGFLQDTFERGLTNSIRRYDTLEKTASQDPYEQGKNDAIDKIAQIKNNDHILGWYQFIKQAHDSPDTQDFAKKAQKLDIDGSEEFQNGFLDAASDVLTSGKDLVKIAFDGPNFLEIRNMFEDGKQSTFQKIAERAQNGHSVHDVLEDIKATLNEDMGKHASEQDVDYRLGVESACHEFVKEATDVYGNYDVSGASDIDVFSQIFDNIEKTAQSQDPFEEGLVAALNDIEKLASSGADISDMVDAVDQTVSQGIEKNASEQEFQSRYGTESACYEFMKTANSIAGAFEVDGRNLVGYTVDNMYEGSDFEGSEAFEMGKEAAFNELVDRQDQGLGGLVDAAVETVYSGIEKNASEQDLDYRRGVDAVCYSLLKEATDTVAQYDLSGVSQQEITNHVLEKTASVVDAAGEAAGEAFESGKRKVRRGVGRAKQRAKEVGGKALDKAWRDRSGKGKAGVVGGTLAAAGTLEAGRRALKRREQQQQQQKTASLNEQSKVSQSLAALEEDGLV